MLRVTLLHFCFTEYTLGLVNGLANYVNLTLIQPQKLSETCRELLDPRIKLLTFAKPRIRELRNVLAMRAMMGLIRESSPDVLHVQETNDFWYDLTLLTHQMPPLVTTIHDVFRHPGDRDLIPGSEYTRRLSFCRSQQLIVHAQSLKEILVKQFRVPAGRVNVLPHGELGSLYQRWAGDRQLERESATLLFFGRIWPYKGLPYLLQAMPLVAERIPNVKLIIAGRGENPRQYFPGDYNPEQYEILNDFIPLESVAGLFQRSTAVILPYIESSQSGVAAIAYALGTPVIASNIGGLGEMIHHGEDGLLVPPKDVSTLAETIIHLLSDRPLQESLRRRAMQRCQTDLDWSTIAAETVEVYKKTIHAAQGAY